MRAFQGTKHLILFFNASPLRTIFEFQLTFCVLLFYFLRLRTTEKKLEKTGYAVYSVPVMIILKLKLVILPAVDDADKVNVALVD